MSSVSEDRRGASGSESGVFSAIDPENTGWVQTSFSKNSSAVQVTWVFLLLLLGHSFSKLPYLVKLLSATSELCCKFTYCGANVFHGQDQNIFENIVKFFWDTASDQTGVYSQLQMLKLVCLDLYHSLSDY